MGCTDISTPSSPVTCEIRAGLLGGWRRFARDPDFEVEERLTGGGPLGIRRQPQDVKVFPVYEDECPDDPEDLESFQDGYEVRGAQAEADDDVNEELLKLSSRKIMDLFDSFEELEWRLGEAPVVSDLIVVTKLSGGR